MNSFLQIPVEGFTTPNPSCVNPDDNLETISQLMTQESCKHIIVTKKTKAVGIISDRDVYEALIEGSSKEVAQNIMSTDIYRVKPSTNIDEVVLGMSDQKIGSAIVEDEKGNVVGIFTLTDVLSALAEIVRGEV